MDASTVSTLIGNFGFPLVAACYMAWLCFKQQGVISSFEVTLKSVQDTLSKMNERLEHLEHSIDGFGKDYTD